MARPRAEINQKQFESLCAIQCTEEEICSVLGVCTETLNAWCKRTYKCRFSEIYRQKRNGGKVSLRRAQWKLAVEKLDKTMLVWMGKQYLNQREVPEDSVDMEDSNAYFED